MRKVWEFISNNFYRIFNSILPVLGGWMFYASIERFLLMFSKGDVNGDGKFTISDIPEHIWDILVAPGIKYQGIFAENKIGVFLEMSGTDPHWFWSIILTGFTYFFLFYGLYMVFGPRQDDIG